MAKDDIPVRDVSKEIPVGAYVNLKRTIINHYSFDGGSLEVTDYQSKSDHSGQESLLRIDETDGGSIFTMHKKFEADLREAQSFLSSVEEEYAEWESAPEWDPHKSMIARQIKAARDDIKGMELDAVSNQDSSYALELPGGNIKTQIKDTEDGISMFTFLSAKADRNFAVTVCETDEGFSMNAPGNLQSILTHVRSLRNQFNREPAHSDLPMFSIAEHLEQAQRKYERDDLRRVLRKHVRSKYDRLYSQDAGSRVRERPPNNDLFALIVSELPRGTPDYNLALTYLAITGTLTPKQMKEDDILRHAIHGLDNRYT